MNAAAFVNRPYTEMDCYALVRAVLASAGIDVPDYRYPAGPTGRAAFVESVRDRWQPVERPKPLDVVLLNIAGHPRHVGVVVGRGRMLHTTSQLGRSRIEPYDDGRHSVAGFYRWTQ